MAHVLATSSSAPPAALLFGGGGLAPFVGLAAVSGMASPATRAAAQTLLVDYAALILCFVGALHWGYAVRDDLRGVRAWRAYGWSVTPALYAWFAMQLPNATALRTLAVGLVGCAVLEFIGKLPRARPPWLMPLRMLLTTVATVSLLVASTA